MAVASDVSAKIWRARKVIASVILVLCPWRLVVHTPLEEDAEEERYRVVESGNVTKLKNILGRQFKNFHDQVWSISIFPT